MARKDKRSIPTGRIHRTAKVAGLAGGQTARNYATKAANLTRSDDSRAEAAARRQAEAAEQIFDVLGQMKGAAMKVGQVASFVDTGAFPPEFQERIQAKLAELRDSAPRVPFKDMRKVIEGGLGERLDNAFAEFEEEAVAAASIGQVYRAKLHDGREVAVKVQYPGVASAVRSDLQNLGLLMRLAKRIAPGMDAKAMAAEIRERLTDELDYEHEAQTQRAFARAWRGHPFIVIPGEDRDFTIDRRAAGQILIEYGDPRSRHWELMKRGTTPPDAMLGFRMQGLTLGVIGQLGATANWHRIAREWLFGDPPSTPLGEAEAGYFGHGDRAAA